MIWTTEPFAALAPEFGDWPITIPVGAFVVTSAGTGLKPALWSTVSALASV